MNILVAEDQEVSRIALTTHLRNWGHQIIETDNGPEALEYASQNRAGVDMLITDWNMPRLGGLGLAARVRDISGDSHYIYIILLTDQADLQGRVRDLTQSEADDYLVKPFEVAELRQRILVGARLITAERRQRLYSQSLERIVRQQTDGIRQTQNEIIERLFSALESRDQETGSHVRRIGFISAQMGHYMAWSEAKIDAIQSAAPLHDVGKIGIPDSILRKPGPLTIEEFAIIKTHATIGAGILAGSANAVINMAESIARYHHENWNGTGYPSALKGPDIPTEARVVAVADFYDALMADRVYRRGLPEASVLENIRQECSHKFDPEIGHLFLDRIADIRQGIQEMENKLSFDAATPFVRQHLVNSSRPKLA